MDLEWPWAACILKLSTKFLCCWRICVVCLALELVGPWVLLGLSVGMEAFDELLLINSLEWWVLWCSQNLDLSFLLLVFSLIFTVASRLLHLYRTIDKISPFKDNGLLFWVPDVLSWHSAVVLWNLLSVQMFFWWICGKESGVPVLFLCHLRTALPFDL